MQPVTPIFMRGGQRTACFLIPDDLRTYTGLDWDAKLVLSWMFRVSKKNICAFPRIDRLSEELVMSRDRVMNATAQLVKEGFLLRRQRRNRKSNIYFFLYKDIFSDFTTEMPTEEQIEELEKIQNLEVDNLYVEDSDIEIPDVEKTNLLKKSEIPTALIRSSLRSELKKENKTSSLPSESDLENSSEESPATEPLPSSDSSGSSEAGKDSDGALHEKELRDKFDKCVAGDIDDLIYAYNRGTNGKGGGVTKIKNIGKVRERFCEQAERKLSHGYSLAEIEVALAFFFTNEHWSSESFPPDAFFKQFDQFYREDPRSTPHQQFIPTRKGSPTASQNLPKPAKTPPPRLEPRLAPPALQHQATTVTTKVPIPPEIETWNAIMPEEFEVATWIAGSEYDLWLANVDHATWPAVCKKAANAVKKNWDFVNLKWVLKSHLNRDKLLQGDFANQNMNSPLRNSAPAANAPKQEYSGSGQADSLLVGTCQVWKTRPMRVPMVFPDPDSITDEHDYDATHKRQTVSGKPCVVCQRCVDAGLDKDLKD